LWDRYYYMVDCETDIIDHHFLYHFFFFHISLMCCVNISIYWYQPSHLSSLTTNHHHLNLPCHLTTYHHLMIMMMKIIKIYNHLIIFHLINFISSLPLSLPSLPSEMRQMRWLIMRWDEMVDHHLSSLSLCLIYFNRIELNIDYICLINHLITNSSHLPSHDDQPSSHDQNQVTISLSSNHLISHLILLFHVILSHNQPSHDNLPSPPSPPLSFQVWDRDGRLWKRDCWFIISFYHFICLIIYHLIFKY